MNHRRVLMRFGVLLAAALHIATASAQMPETESLTLAGNLDAGSAVTSGIPANPTTYSMLNATAQFSTFVDLFDSLMGRHTLTIYFFHTSTNAWTVNGYVDGSEITGGTAGIPTAVFATPLVFSSTGASVPAAPSVTGFAPWSNGAASQSLIVVFNPFTQFFAPSNISNISSTPTPTPTPTPAPTASPSASPIPSPVAGDCLVLRSCLTSSLDAAFNSCLAAASSCAEPPDDFVVTAELLAQRAVVAARCDSRAVRSRSACRRCYATAARLLDRGKDQELFRRMLARARDIVEAAKAEVCR